MLLGPSAELLQHSDLFFRNGTVLFRTDINKDYRPCSGSLQMYEARYRVIYSYCLYADIPMNHSWSYKAPNIYPRDAPPALLFGSSIVAISLYARIDNHILIIRTEQIYNTFGIPSFRTLFPVSVEPIQIRFPCFVQLRQLSEIELVESGPTFRIIFITYFRTGFVWVIRMRPVQ